MADGLELPSDLIRQQRIDVARRYVEAAETWLRRIIHHQFVNAYGPHYLQIEGLISKRIRDQVRARKADPSLRFARDIDATTFEHVVDIVTKQEFYRERFKQVLDRAYPGNEEVPRHFLKILSNIRNDISHGRGCSARQVEQAICYTNDLIDALKQFFKDENMAQVYNVPTIIRFSDNQGNEHTLEGVPTDVNSRYIDWRQIGKGDLHVGDELVAEIEVDPSFDAVEYRVSWMVFGDHENYDRDGSVARIAIGTRHVGEQFELRFRVITAREWHRFFECDDGLGLIYRVLPP
jgi:hypothetical protein